MSKTIITQCLRLNTTDKTKIVNKRKPARINENTKSECRLANSNTAKSKMHNVFSFIFHHIQLSPQPSSLRSVQLLRDQFTRCKASWWNNIPKASSLILIKGTWFGYLREISKNKASWGYCRFVWFYTSFSRFSRNQLRKERVKKTFVLVWINAISNQVNSNNHLL